MPFRLPELTRCCFAFRLRTGALIIGYLAGLTALLNLLAIIWLLIFVPRLVRDPPPNASGVQEVTIDRSTALRIYITYGIDLLVQLWQLALALMLVVGVHKNIPRLVRLYFVVGAIALIFDLLMTCVTALYNGFFITFWHLFTSALHFYFLLVIRSAHLEMVARLKPDAALELGAHPAPAPPHTLTTEPLIAQS